MGRRRGWKRERRKGKAEGERRMWIA